MAFDPKTFIQGTSFNPKEFVSSKQQSFDPKDFVNTTTTEDDVFSTMSPLMKTIDIISRPGYAVKSGIKELMKDTSKTIPEAMTGGFTGKERVTGNELWGMKGVSGIPLLGFATEVVTDPTNLIPGKVLAAPFIGAAKVMKIGAEVVSKIPGISHTLEALRPVTQSLKEAFVTKSGIKELSDLVGQHLSKREYLKGKSLEFGIGIRNSIQDIARKYKLPIQDVEKQIVSFIEQPAQFANIPQEMQHVGNVLKSNLSDMLTAEMKAGVPITALSEGNKAIEYFPRITSKEAQTYLRQAAGSNYGGNASVWWPKLQNVLKRRTADYTLDEFNKLVAENGLESLGGRAVESFFMQKPAEAVFIRGTRSAKAITSAEFLNDVGRVFGKDSVEAGFKKMPEFITNLNPSLSNKFFHPDVVNEVTKVVPLYIDPKATNPFLQHFDNIQNLWKQWTLAPFAKYHLRNMVGNLWNNYLADVSLPSYAKASALQMWDKFKGTGSQLEKQAIQALDKFGISPETANGLLESAKQNMVVRHGFYGGDIERSAKNLLAQDFMKQSLPEKIKRIVIPNSKNVAITTGMKVGTVIEDNARLAHFLDKLGKGMDASSASASTKKYLFDYNDLTAFEKTWMKRLMPFYTWCVSEDTECLTKSGWKTHDKVLIGEEILSYNIENKKYEWDIIKEIGKFDYDYKLMHFYGKSIDLLCSFDHCCVTENGIKQAYKISQGDTVPTIGIYEQEDFDISDKNLKIISWIVTDGYSRMRGNSLEAVIYQKKEPHLSELKELLKPDYSEFIHPETGVVCLRIIGETRKEVSKYFSDKKMLWNLFIELSKRQLLLCMDEMMKAEGNCSYKDTTKEFKHFSQEGKEVLDCFQLCTILTGCTSSISQRGIYLRTKENIKYPIPEIINYKGIIWCPVTNNGTWISRRNGKILITGNTRKNLPLQLESIINQPKKFLPLAIPLRNQDPESMLQLKYATPNIYERLPIQFKKTVDSATYIPMEGLIPAADLSKIARPQELILELLNPFLKTPIELAANKSFYTESEIEKYPKQTQELLKMDIPVKLKYAATTILPYSRILNSINSLIVKNEAQKLGKDVKFTNSETALYHTLTYVYKVDLKELRERAVQKLYSNMEDLQRGLYWAKENGREKEFVRIKEEVNRIRKEIGNVKASR